jgi:hypothetical protein
MTLAARWLAAATFSLGVVVPAGAITLATPALAPEPDGRLVCTIVNVTRRAFDMGAAIVTATGGIVTDFAWTVWSNDGRLIQLVVEANADDARACAIDIGTNRKNSVQVVLEAFDAQGVRTGVVEGAGVVGGR